MWTCLQRAAGYTSKDDWTLWSMGNDLSNTRVELIDVGICAWKLPKPTSPCDYRVTKIDHHITSEAPTLTYHPTGLRMATVSGL